MKLKSVYQILMVVLVTSLVLFFFAKKGPQMIWTPYSPQVLEQAVKEQKPVIIDFFAEWCLPCHELDHHTYSDSRVIDFFSSYVRIKVDATKPDHPTIKELLKHFNVSGLPVILFLDPEGREIEGSRINGFITAESLLERASSPSFQARLTAENKA